MRIFDGGESPFVLKGGHGMLARTLDARRTRNIDIATDGLDVEAALRELRGLVSRDMDDFLSYEVVGRLSDPAFAGACGGMRWDPEATSWGKKAQG